MPSPVGSAFSRLFKHSVWTVTLFRDLGKPWLIHCWQNLPCLHRIRHPLRCFPCLRVSLGACLETTTRTTRISRITTHRVLVDQAATGIGSLKKRIIQSHQEHPHWQEPPQHPRHSPAHHHLYHTLSNALVRPRIAAIMTQAEQGMLSPYPKHLQGPINMRKQVSMQRFAR
jgi:hypothetical protein